MKPAHPQYGLSLLTEARKTSSMALDYLEFAAAVIVGAAIGLVPMWIWG